MENALNLKSLREQVYDFLKSQLNLGALRPGAYLNLAEISEQMGISKTPLRDALIQLEVEGFVTILPRRGVLVNRLTLEAIRNIYELLGGIESVALVNIAHRFTEDDAAKMLALNEEMRTALDRDDFDTFYERNLDFHNVYIGLSDNADLKRMVNTLRERLYEFPRRKVFKEWEVNSTGEHEEFAKMLARRDFRGAAEHIRDVHWSFDVQERFIEKYYFAQQEEQDA